MNTHYVFPTPFYEFDLSDILEDIKTLVAIQATLLSPHYPGLSQTSNQVLHTLPEWLEVKNRIEDSLLEIQKTEGYDPAFGHLRLSRLWANVAPKGSGGQHTKHRHPMSLLSGIIYLTEGEPTKFLDPCSARTGAAIEIPNNALFNDLLITPNPGMMIVFPSYVDHLTMPHYGTEDHRMTLAWNSLPERMVP